MEAALSPRPVQDIRQKSVAGQLVMRCSAVAPVLELCEPDGARSYPFKRLGAGRTEGESTWLAEPNVPASGPWQFRIRLGEGVYDAPLYEACYETTLRTLWLQDKQLFAYEPPCYVSPSRVEKIDAFEGSLPTRPLYVYLPRGYDVQPEKRYPVLYMHDGQNCFEAYIQDSYAGSWRADEVANRLIAAAQMQEAVIVGVSNGREMRMEEYLPPYAAYRFYPGRVGSRARRSIPLLTGRADETAAYYQREVAPFIARHYRILEDREHTATLGSSMGGLFSWYLAFDHPDFAQHHAAMSSTFWITNDGRGRLTALTRLSKLPERDIRLWLDSGEGKDRPGSNDDNKYVTLEAREALLEAGYEEGEDFVYHLAEGARHHESDWATRLEHVFRFLMPAGSG